MNFANLPRRKPNIEQVDFGCCEESYQEGIASCAAGPWIDGEPEYEDPWNEVYLLWFEDGGGCVARLSTPTGMKVIRHAKINIPEVKK